MPVIQFFNISSNRVGKKKSLTEIANQERWQSRKNMRTRNNWSLLSTVTGLWNTIDKWDSTTDCQLKTNSEMVKRKPYLSRCIDLVKSPIVVKRKPLRMVIEEWVKGQRGMVVDGYWTILFEMVKGFRYCYRNLWNKKWKWLTWKKKEEQIWVPKNKEKKRPHTINCLLTKLYKNK